MKINITQAIAFTIIGLSLGVLLNKFPEKKFLNHLEETKKIVTEQQWIEADSYLSVARSIRNKKYNEVLKFSEGMVEMKVLGFTRMSKIIGSLSEHELSTINKVKEYKNKHCKKECLKRLNGILK